MNVDPIERIMAFYASLDSRIASARCLDDIRCPPGCGICCRSPNVEASALEMLPVASHLYGSGGLDLWLEAAERTEGRACIFHTPDKLQYGHGRCAIYPFRPLMCRLFGYSAVRDKNGRPTLVTCRLVNRLVPEQAAAARAAVAQGAEIPFMTDVTSALQGIDPHLGSALMPINEAFLRAVERVGLIYQLSHLENELEVTPEPDDPIRPSPLAA